MDPARKEGTLKMPQNNRKLPVIAGIDPSLTSTGVAWFGSKGLETRRIQSKPTGQLVSARLDRYRMIAREVLRCIPKGALVYLEHYAFSRSGRATLDLAENGGILRAALEWRGHAIIEVEPSTLRTFITGRPRRTKEEIKAKIPAKAASVTAINKATGLDLALSRDDEADAIGLLWLGMAVQGRPPWKLRLDQQALAKRFMGFGSR